MSAAKSVNQVKGKVSGQVQNISHADPFILPLSLRNERGKQKTATQVSNYMWSKACTVIAGETGIKVQVSTLIGGHRIIFRGHKLFIR